MDHFEDPANVEAYASLTAEAVNERVLEVLRARVQAGARLLEIGSGPGHDLAHLRTDFDAVASDKSAAFVAYIRRTQPELTAHVLDARTLEIDETFDAIFSNKVLQYLSDHELAASFERQLALLGPGGLALHTLWRGQGKEKELKLTTWLRESAALEKLLPTGLVLEDTSEYAEQAPGDSFWVVLRASR